MLVQVHVLTKFGKDIAAFTSKRLALASGDKQAAELGLPVGEMDPDSFHYSVIYQPMSVSSDHVFIVNADAIPLYAFDEFPAADAKARDLAKGELGSNITINRVSLVRGEESELENIAISLAVANGLASLHVELSGEYHG